MKASDAIVKLLAAHHVEFCFELIGGMIAHLIDSMVLDGRFTITSMHHEQSAAFAAEGVGRASKGRKIAVAMGTSGPGATNLITGIGSCWFDSVPCLFLTGQVNTDEMRDNSLLRQQGFQELDIVKLVGSITKYAKQVNDVEQLLPALHQALSLAFSGRQGPVLLDIPNNIQRMDIPDAIVTQWLEKPLDTESVLDNRLSVDSLSTLKSLCVTAEKPLVCIGGGARWSSLLDVWLQDLEACGIPYVSTLMGHECVLGRDHYFKMIGVYGHKEANWAIQNCDLLIVIGARMDVRQTGSNAEDFARNAKIVQVDVDGAQLNNRVKVDLPLQMTTDAFCKDFKVRPALFPQLASTWVAELTARRTAHAIDYYPDWTMSPSLIFDALNQSLVSQPISYVCDVGNHQMWAAQGLRLEDQQSIHYSGGMGAMGFALPAAIGVAMSVERKTIVLTGDGSLQVNSQELDTIYRLQPDMTIIVLNNFSLGMVKNFQDMYFSGRDQSTRQGYSCPSFVAIGVAYGIESICVHTIDELKASFERMNQTTKPLLIEVIMPEATECRPRLAFGRKLGDE